MEGEGRLGIKRFGAILGPALFGILSDANLSTATLFLLFSVPLLISGAAVFNIPWKNLD